MARRFGSFPVILETYRECLNDWFDLPALRAVLRPHRARASWRWWRSRPRRRRPSPARCCSSTSRPTCTRTTRRLAERRAQALSLNRDLLRELLGQEELRDLIDADALAALEADLQGLSERARARGADGLHDLLRRIGDLSPAEIGRAAGRARRRRRRLVDELIGRAARLRVRVGGEERVIAAEDAGRYRDAPRRDAARRPARGVPGAGAGRRCASCWRATRAPTGRSTPPSPPARTACRRAVAGPALARSRREGTLVRGRAPPRRIGPRVVRRRGGAPPAPRQPGGAAAGDRAGRPAGPRALPARLAAHRPPGRRARHGRACARRSRALQGLALPAAQWEGEVLPRRLADYGPARLDELAAARRDRVGGRGRRRRRRRAGWRSTSARTRRCSGPPPGRPARPRARWPTRCARRSPRGASFWDDLLAAAPARRARTCSPRSGRSSGPARSPTTSGCRCARRGACRPLPRPERRRPAAARGRPGAAARPRPSRGAGRWPSALFRDGPAAGRAAPRPGRAAGGAPRRAHPLRPCSRRASPGGFAAVYPALPTWRRSAPAAAATSWPASAAPSSRCRARSSACATCATRPADERPARRSCSAPPTPPSPTAPPCPWPRREGGRSPSRVFGAQVVLVDGVPRLYLERGGRGILTFDARRPGALAPALRALADWILADRRRRAAVERVDGEPVFGSPLEPLLAEAGFRADLRAMVLRA